MIEKQPLRPVEQLQFVVALEPSIAANVEDVCSAIAHDATDQQAAMADRRVFLAAHDGDAIEGDAAFEAVDRFDECGGLGDPVVERVPLVVIEVPTFRTTSQFIAHEKILDAVMSCGPADAVLVEMGNEFGIGVGTRVDEHLDPMLHQEVDEPFKRMIRMAYREQNWRIRVPHSDGPVSWRWLRRRHKMIAGILKVMIYYHCPTVLSVVSTANKVIVISSA